MSKKHFLTEFLQGDEYRMDILRAIKKIKTEELWIAGGFLRNLVWDQMHNYKHRTELGDIDVFFFNKNTVDKNIEIELKNNLTQILHNVNWSVKNQARMHFHDNNDEYKDLTDAISKFPETSSAIAARINDKGELDIIAPFGFDDLFELKIKPTPNCKKNPITYKRYLNRQVEKKWKAIWPLLKIEK